MRLSLQRLLKTDFFQYPGLASTPRQYKLNTGLSVDLRRTLVVSQIPTDFGTLTKLDSAGDRSCATLLGWLRSTTGMCQRPAFYFKCDEWAPGDKVEWCARAIASERQCEKPEVPPVSEIQYSGDYCTAHEELRRQADAIDILRSGKTEHGYSSKSNWARYLRLKGDLKDGEWYKQNPQPGVDNPWVPALGGGSERSIAERIIKEEPTKVIRSGKHAGEDWDRFKKRQGGKTQIPRVPKTEQLDAMEAEAKAERERKKVQPAPGSQTQVLVDRKPPAQLMASTQYVPARVQLSNPFRPPSYTGSPAPAATRNERARSRSPTPPVRAWAQQAEGPNPFALSYADLAVGNPPSARQYIDMNGSDQGSLVDRSGPFNRSNQSSRGKQSDRGNQIYHGRHSSRGGQSSDGGQGSHGGRG